MPKAICPHTKRSLAKRATAGISESLNSVSTTSISARSAKPLRLPMWEDGWFGIPKALACSGLFGASKSDGETKRKSFCNEQVPALPQIRIKYLGSELRQDDWSVFLAILYFGRHYELGRPIPFSAYQMLRAVGWSINSAEYRHLAECCKRLSATSVTVAHDESGKGYSGSLLREYACKEGNGRDTPNWSAVLEPGIGAFFAGSAYTLISAAQRKSIGGRAPLAQWLHAFLGAQRTAESFSIKQYYDLSACGAVQFSDFRRRLKHAMERLVEVGFLEEYRFADDFVHTRRAPDTRQAVRRQWELSRPAP